VSAFRDDAATWFRDLQQRIVSGLESLEGAPFERTPWAKPPEGEGPARLRGEGVTALLRGELFEKAGVNFSAVSGDRYPAPGGAGAQAEGRTGANADAAEDAALGIRPPAPEELAGKPFFACGVSLVVHPRSPFVPVVHMNVRYLEVGDPERGGTAWFGGGADLTPCRPFADDTAHFHQALRSACDAHDARFYPRFSRWARDYFWIAHRHSERGVGGVFFDYLRGDRAAMWSFVRAAGDAFLPAYAPLVERRRGQPWTEEDRDQQLRWRGRYVEFNLVYDRGTLFGLKTGGNIDAILMSLPPEVKWR
jgi:coproporphyrinogen III oxidase